MKGKVLVTGGAGYIGSHTIVDLFNKGYDVISVDNYINSDPVTYDQIESITGKKVAHYNIDICDKVALKRVMDDHRDVVGIIHFAALKAVGESVEFPFKYYHNNIVGLLNMLDLCRTHDINAFIFSSSCTVYGIPTIFPVTESTPLQPASSPYGATKQMGEQIIQDCMEQMECQAIMLRYFNPAGAHPSGLMGESPINKAANLVPAITETAIGKRDHLTVFGGDYDSRDGSCIRDYIHVMDLAGAHTLSLEYIVTKKQKVPVEIFNLGIGQGATVLEVIKAFESTTGVNLKYEMGPRRPGDVPAIYSNYQKIQKLLGWSPEYKIEDIMKTAWDWEKNRSRNY